jgi:4-diphosphocytidyl-2-C-methyl-D-erythritol kinase
VIVSLLAPAKINLGIEILGRRADGYHEIRTIFATVSLCDRLRVRHAPKTTLYFEGAEVADRDNLVLAAVELVRTRHPDLSPAIDLRKRIPVAAGLGGASSDAAATLVACDRLLGIGASPETLHASALQLGSDVPFFLTGGLAIARGRGELIEALPSPPRTFAVIVAPRLLIPAKTKRMYGSLLPRDFSNGDTIERLARTGIAAHPRGVLPNAFNRALYEIAPWLEELPATLIQLGAIHAGLSGAGPAHYGLVRELDVARQIASTLRTSFQDRAAVHVVRLLPRGMLVAVEADEPNWSRV